MIRIRLLCLPVIALALVAGLFADTAAAQAPPSQFGKVGLDFEIRGGALQPDGSAAFSMTAPQDDDTFDEYWSLGTGGGADVSMPLFLAGGPKMRMHIAVAPFIGFDHYELTGDTKKYDNGAKLEVDNWTATTFFGGVQLRVNWGLPQSFFRTTTGIGLAGGMVSYGGVSADFIATPGATPIVGHLFDSSTTSALRASARIGFMFALSEAAHLNVQAVGGVLMLGAPEGNTDANNPFGDSDPEAWMPYFGAVAISLRLRF